MILIFDIRVNFSRIHELDDVVEGDNGLEALPINVAKDKFRIVCHICRPLNPVAKAPQTIPPVEYETRAERANRERLNKETVETYWNITRPRLIRLLRSDMTKYLDWTKRLVPITWNDAIGL